MNDTSEVCRAVGAYMNRAAAYVGPFEAVYDAMFGPLDHNAHVVCRAAHIEAGSLADRLRAADEAVRAECDRQMEEFRARLARNNPSYSIAAE